MIILDGKPRMVSSLENRSEVSTDMPSALVIDYDFDAAKLSSYEYYFHTFPQAVPKALSEGKELDDRLASLLSDNSSLHQQTAYAGSSELKELYEKAAQIGNKYGVHIYLGENLPSYILSSQSLCESSTLHSALDKIDTLLGKFPEGYFDQLKYGQYSGLEICLLHRPLWEELTVYATDHGYAMSIALDCREDSMLDSLEDKLLDAIFFATDLKLKAYFENFAEPYFSEAVWKTYNPDSFSYTGFDDSDYSKNIYEENKAYFATFKSMRYAPKDRSQLMTSLMQSKDLGDACLRKAEFYSLCIRKAFDDSNWPEKTVWEEAASQTGSADAKAA